MLFNQRKPTVTITDCGIITTGDVSVIDKRTRSKPSAEIHDLVEIHDFKDCDKIIAIVDSARWSCEDLEKLAESMNESFSKNGSKISIVNQEFIKRIVVLKNYFKESTE